MVIPLERVTGGMTRFAGLVKLAGGKIVTAALKGPMSAPPAPETVYAPGDR
jgi:hypothetical protein